ncbi:MAG: triose-phosphate isomerase [Pseudomonadota bacterium]
MRLVAGNWKMNGDRALARDLVSGLAAKAAETPPACALAVCPPAFLLDAVAAAASPAIALGAQDCSDEAGPGAFTGEISASQLAEAGCRYVIVGHSERRQRHGETSALVQAKAARVMEAGLVPIICVGETLETREAGDAQSFVTGQLRDSLPLELAAKASENGEGPALVVAYEPVWAIGTGRSATTDDIAEMHTALAELLGPLRARTPLLYGGSVKPGNAAEIFATAEVDGALVGGASLTLDAFWGIATAA